MKGLISLMQAYYACDKDHSTLFNLYNINNNIYITYKNIYSILKIFYK
jgi:hypothetical protein